MFSILFDLIWHHQGRAVGIIIGCIIGMAPLYFISSPHRDENHEEGEHHKEKHCEEEHKDHKEKQQNKVEKQEKGSDNSWQLFIAWI